jgi:hypothetical protein
MVLACLSRPLRPNGVVSPGEYLVQIVGGTRWSDNTPFGLTVKILEGKFGGRQVQNRLVGRAKREAQSLGVNSGDDLSGLCCLVRITVATAPDGSNYNLVKRFQMLGYEEPGLSDYLPYEN